MPSPPVPTPIVERRRARGEVLPKLDAEGRRAAKSVMVIVAALALLGARRACREQELSFLREASGLPLPDRPSDYFGQDDAEMSVTAAMILSPHEQSAVLGAARFHPALHPSPSAPSDPSRLFRAESLPSRYQNVQPGSTLLHASGCPPHQSWVALLEPSSGRLWVQVLYPDHGGDDPGCDSCQIDDMVEKGDGDGK